MKKILFIEDEASVREASKKLLEGAGFMVDTAVDGIEAVNFLSMHSYDLVITDIVMPQKDGFEVIQYLSERQTNSRIIAISGGERFSARDHSDETRLLKIDAVLSKPYAFRDLVNTIQGLFTNETIKAYDQDCQYLE